MDAVGVLKHAMSLGAPDPVLSAVVKKHHLEAGKSVVNRFEGARVAQATRHEEIVRMANAVKLQTSVVNATHRSWAALDKDMDETMLLLESVSQSLAECSSLLVSVQLRIPQMELELTRREREVLHQQEMAWKENTSKSVEDEMAQIKQKLDQRYRDALQAAFDEQMKRFRESGVAPPQSFKAATSIAEIELHADEREKEEMESFFGESDNDGASAAEHGEEGKNGM